LTACTIAILLTGSRKALVCVVVAFAMLPMALPRLSRKQRYLALVAIAVILICAAYVVPEQTWARLMTVGSDVQSGNFGGRAKIWAAGLEAFREHPFFGVGGNAYGASVVKALDVPYYAHSSYISVLVELGVVGELIFLTFLFCMFYSALQLQGLERRVWTLLLLTWAVAALTATWEFTRPSWLLFGLLAARVGMRPARPQFAFDAPQVLASRPRAAHSHWR
jgi:O-antigen ligase